MNNNIDETDNVNECSENRVFEVIEANKKFADEHFVCFGYNQGGTCTQGVTKCVMSERMWNYPLVIFVAHIYHYDKEKINNFTLRYFNTRLCIKFMRFAFQSCNEFVSDYGEDFPCDIDIPLMEGIIANYDKIFINFIADYEDEEYVNEPKYILDFGPKPDPKEEGEEDED